MELYKKAIERGKRLTASEIDRAIAIDFEGEGDSKTGESRPPVLLGTRQSNELSFFLLDPRLKIFLRGQWPIEKRVALTSFDEAIAQILKRSILEDRLIIFFSQHEPAVIDQLATGDLLERLSPRLADTKPLLCKAARVRTGARVREQTLFELAKLWRPRLTDNQLDVEVGNTIRRLRKAATGKTRLNQVSEPIRECYRALLSYNASDLKMMQESAKAAAKLLGQV